MNNSQIADILEQMGTLIELKEDNAFRARAYHNAARVIQNLSIEVAELQASGELTQVSGLGKEMRGHIAELLSTGTLTFYTELVASIEPGLIAMLQISGLGPKRIRMLHDQLQVTTMEELATACREGKVAVLSGFGVKTQANILKGIEFLTSYASSFSYAPAFEIADAIVTTISRIPGVIRASVAGSLRRRKEIVHDIDAVASVTDDAARDRLMDAFTSLPQAQAVINKGDAKSTIQLPDGLKMDLRVVDNADYASVLHHFTGSKEHHIALRGRALKQGISINDYGLWRGEDHVPIATEAEIYATFGMDYIEPELREDRGEIEAAIQHTLPQLITKEDIQGVLHCHTTYSDGHATLREMAEACIVRGYTYLGICDHSQVAAYAHGLTPADVRRQHVEIDALNAEYGSRLRILKGTECDILKDGTLDFDNETLASFEFVVASIHSVFTLSEAEQTARLIRAIENPYVTIMGHLTGRLLLQREGYAVDIPAVIRAAAARGVAIELNANPARFDLDWRWHRLATEQGVYIPICPDAHATNGLDDIQFGVGIARKGWLTPQQVPNAWQLAQLLQWFATVRKTGKK